MKPSHKFYLKKALRSVIWSSTILILPVGMKWLGQYDALSYGELLVGFALMAVFYLVVDMFFASREWDMVRRSGDE